MNTPNDKARSPLYQLHNVGRKYGSDFSLLIDHLEIQTGETLALVGPTGAGKSTLLRILTGYELNVSGTVNFRGQPLHEHCDINELRRIAMVHQRSHLLAGSVQYNIACGPRWRGQVDEAKLNMLLTSLGLDRLRQQHARTLSGGQAQLTGLARGLATGSEVLILDEPTANLDPARVMLVENVVQQHKRDRPLTLVWATHNLHQARRVADRVALILDGRLVEVAPTETFFDEPREAVTREFVEGRMVY